jgi:hypothetical protein
MMTFVMPTDKGVSRGNLGPHSCQKDQAESV